MYEAFYGFKEKPFSMLPDPGFLFLSKKHQAALTLLEYGLLNHVGFCVISGEPGAGKTTILRALLERTGDAVTVGLITNTHQSFGGLLDWVLSSFDLHRPNLTHVEMHQIFMEFLIEEYANKRTVLLIVDEAQNMNADALEELRMLSNVNSEKDQLMQVVLAGQPALRETLRKPELMQFAQRIAVDYHLDTLSLEETCGYIQHRLVTAGAERDVFTPAACERIYTYSGGTPRLINLLCETVLVYGFADQQDVIDVELVDEMVQERMKNSVVPIVNRDIAKQDNSKESSKQLEKDFPWIRPEGGTRGLKPSDEVDSDELPEIKQDYIKPEIIAPDEDETALELHGFSNRGKVAEPIAAKTAPAKTEVKKIVKPEASSSTIKSAPAPSRTFIEAEKSILSANEPAEGDGQTLKQLIKYGLIAIVFAFVLIALALALNDESINKAEVVNDEVLELQKQQEQEAARLQQLQAEAEALKQERDAAIVRMEEEKRAKLEAEKIAAEKAALAIKMAEDQRKLEEQKKLADAKVKERQVKQAEAREKTRAKTEADRVKREAVALEEERRLMKARLEEEIRLKQEQEARRMALELQEKQRLALEQEKSRVELQADAAAAEDKAKKELVECSGPTARFKSVCR
jgi:type II secretory pathway predicted ATPase ExeA